MQTSISPSGFQLNPSLRFGFNGQEKTDEISGAGNHTTALYWEYDTRLGRRWNIDPMTHIRVGWTPYNALRCNPILNIDPTGALDAPIYDTDGNIMGTDDQGLQGKAIIMEKDKFEQGMKHEDALKNNKGYEGLKNDEAKKNFSTSYSSLKLRPDYDGKLTLDEANKWYQTGGGKPLFVDGAKVDLSPVEKSDFGKVGDSFYKNFAFTNNRETGLVYGNIKLTLMNDKGVVKLGGKGGLLDIYDFDYKSGMKNIPRNIATLFGEINAGKGTGFNIYNYGTGTIK